MDKCLAFCQSLIQSDQKFTLSLAIGKDKLFFSNKELESSWKKKKSPSQVRREERRKRERQSKPTEEVPGDAAVEATVKKTVCSTAAVQAEVPSVIICEECDYKATTEKGLKQHKRMKHRKFRESTTVPTSPLSTPEVTRRQTLPGDLNSSPLPNIPREDTCHNCREIFTSEHQCDDTQIETQSEQIDEDQTHVEVKLNEDGSKPVICTWAGCGKGFTGKDSMNAWRIKNKHIDDVHLKPNQSKT